MIDDEMLKLADHADKLGFPTRAELDDVIDRFDHILLSLWDTRVDVCGIDHHVFEEMSDDELWDSFRTYCYFWSDKMDNTRVMYLVNCLAYLRLRPRFRRDRDEGQTDIVQ